MADPRDTNPSFPTYASLIETAAWRDGERTEVEPDPVPEAEDTGDDAFRARYREGALLGAGGMGRVVLARDERIGREVAVKELHGRRALTAEERARFLREARVQGQLEHPSIVPVYDIDRRADGTTFFTMRRVLGKTLHIVLEELRHHMAGAATRYTQRELLSAFATVCLAVDYAHSRGVIHRDLKPANIMLGDFGEVYVLDWGLARIVGAPSVPDEPAPRLSTPGEMMGTPLYMAPEQMADPDVGVAADVFSLGAILFELLTLVPLRDPKAPFVPPDARPSLRAPDRRIAPELETICVTATHADPAERYASARALHQAVIRYLEGDRELERRRELAAEHARTARAALERAAHADASHVPLLAAEHEAERGKAMRELVRALAFDPTDREHVALLAQLLGTPPKVLPREVHEELRREAQQMLRNGARHSGVAMLSWFLFLPALLWIGIRQWSGVWWIGVPAAISALLSFIATRQRVISPVLQFAMILFMMIGATGLSRLYGPLVLMPTMIATYAIVLQAHPASVFRHIGGGLAVIAIALPVLLEVTGAIPASYVFDAGKWIIEPQLLALPRTPTLAFLTVANLALVIVPCAFIARLRTDLAEAQQRQAIQAWHFRRLGEELVRASNN